jgi:hypothetical protein
VHNITSAIRDVMVREAAGTLDPSDTAESIAADRPLSEYVRGMADLIYRVTGEGSGDEGVALATAEILAAVPVFYGVAR